MIRLNSQTIEKLSVELELIITTETTIEDKFSDLSKWFYKAIKSASATKPIAFRNFYAQYKFVTSQINWTDDERNNLEGYRLLIKRKDMDRHVNSSSCSQATLLLTKLLSSFQNTVHPTIPSQNSGYDNSYFNRFLSAKRNDNIQEITIVISNWTPIHGEGSQEYFSITGYATENLQGAIFVHISNTAYNNHNYIHALLSPDVILNFKHLRAKSGQPSDYETTFETLITIEPDFLVDATAIGECFQGSGASSENFILNKLLTDLPGSAALKGIMVGHYLDDMVRGEANNEETTFLRIQKEYAIQAAQFGDEAMAVIKTSIEQDHLQNIRNLVNTESQNDLWIEPTYFSKEFGLQGRIDLLSIEGKNNSRNVIELKSSNPTNPNIKIAWPNHQAQVICYDMLLESTYGEGRQGTNSLFYSKTNPIPRRSIVSEGREKQSVLNIRNQIVNDIFNLSLNDFSILNKIQLYGIEHIPIYKINSLRQYQELYRPGLNSTEYYKELVAFTLRELINGKVGQLAQEGQDEHQNGFAGLWLDSRQVKESNFDIIYDLQVSAIEEIKGYIHLKFSKDIPHSFRKGDMVVLYPRKENEYVATSQHILKGSIKILHTTSMTVSLFNKQTDYAFIKDHEYWAVEPDFMERNYWSTIGTLFNFLTCGGRKQQLLLGVMEPGFSNQYTIPDENLTEQQHTCIAKAINASDYFLLQGPPGTGKTGTFLVNYIREVLSQTNQKVVVLAFTNKAVDKICNNFRDPRFGQAISFLRIGSKHVNDVNLFSEMISSDSPNEWKRLLENNRVLVSTVASFQNNMLLLNQFMHFQQVVIDEASQLTEADLAGILARFEKFVLIGDHKQLPAVVTQNEKSCFAKNEQLLQFGIKDLRISLFERLITKAQNMNWNRAYGQMSDHYRMHQSIASLISHHYSIPLRAFWPKQELINPALNVSEEHPLRILNQSRTIFIETPPDPAPKKNIKEARLAAWIAQILINDQVLKPNEIGIITPFRAQIAEIKNHLPQEILDQDELVIDTVERYQGDERKLIIISTTVANSAQVGNIQSIASHDPQRTDRKLLVSLSRAEDQLIILGNSFALQSTEAYRELLAQISQNNGYISRGWTDRIFQEILNRQHQ